MHLALILPLMSLESPKEGNWKERIEYFSLSISKESYCCYSPRYKWELGIKFSWNNDNAS